MLGLRLQKLHFLDPIARQFLGQFFPCGNTWQGIGKRWMRRALWLPGWALLSIGDKPLWLQPLNSVETSSPGFTPSKVGVPGSFTAVPPTPGHALLAASVPAWPWPLSSESLDLLLQGSPHLKFSFFQPGGWYLLPKTADLLVTSSWSRRSHGLL